MLQQIGVEFQVSPQHIDESPLAGETAQDLVCRLAAQKAQSCLASHAATDVVALGSDTTVVLDGNIMGQPESKDEAVNMLSSLSGSQHQVLTAVSLATKTDSQTQLSITEVRFRPLSNEEIEAYWHTGEPSGKAGAYAIQGYAAVFVESIAGSYSGVMGLPLFETAQLLGRFGINCWRPENGNHNE